MDGLGLLSCFLNMLVVVDTPLGPVAGVLVKADSSRHNGIGCLLLETRSGWLLIKEWIAVKRRM